MRNYPHYQFIQGFFHKRRSVGQLVRFTFLALFISFLAINPSSVIATVFTDEQVITAAPGKPELIGPANSTLATGANFPPLGLPQLTWTPVDGANQYRIEISLSTGFADPVIKKTTYASSYIPEVALMDGTYYWRVQAGQNGVWGDFSDPRSFTKQWSNDGSLVPALLSPAADVEISSFSHDEFSWTPVDGAAHYLLEISLDPASFSTPDYSARTLKAHHTPIARLKNKQYYWRVTAVDNQGNLGTSSAIRSFQFSWNSAPALLSPANAVDLQFVPQFSWTAVEAASSYQLEISTDPFFNTILNSFLTHNTEYTPDKAFSNDQDYYWRVKAIDAQATSSPYSEARQFRAKWNFAPELLTPANSSVQHSYPFFSWTPVPGVERYQLHVDESTSFEFPLVDIEVHNATTAGITKFKQNVIPIQRDLFWRVRAIDAQDNYGPWSRVNSFTFDHETSPNLIYPPQYFAPDTLNLPVHRDETIAWPLFVWNTAHVWEPYPIVSLPPDYYEVVVSDQENFSSVNFQIETRGLAVAPTLRDPFTNLQNGGIYYWRVRAIRNGQQMGIDAIRKVRIDTTVPQMPFTDTMTLIYPVSGFEAVGDPPVLGWQPYTEASNYRLQVSRDREFTDVVEDVSPQFVNYVPGQGSRDPLPFGTYWWRVRAESAPNTPLSDWSSPRYFNLSVDVIHGNPHDNVTPVYPNSLFTETIIPTITFPPVDVVKYRPEWTYVAQSSGQVTDQFGLGELHIMLNRVHLKSGDYPKTFDSLSWIVAFETNAFNDPTVQYGLYIDIDHVIGSGAPNDPLGKPISAHEQYYPEYVLYVQPDGGPFNASKVLFFAWNGTTWSPQSTLQNIGGDSWFDTKRSALQILIPYTSIRSADEGSSGSMAFIVFSTETNSGIRDAVPPQSSVINRPAFVSDMLMPLFPFDTPLHNPMVYLDAPSMVWRQPYYDSNDGYNLEIARDARFTDIVESWTLREEQQFPDFMFLTSVYHPLQPFYDNESYYWRVSVRHEQHGFTANDYDDGPWSPLMRFKLDSRRVGNPTLSTGDLAETTPTFSWDRVEGAAGYVLQVDKDAKFSNPIINKLLDGTSYTPDKALADGTYYWRVAIRRSDKVIGEWTSTMSFVKQSLTPTLIAPIHNATINAQPTFRWTAVLTPTDTPRVAAPSYQLQFDTDPNFSNPKTFKTDSTSITIDKNKFGLIQSLKDGTWYWRVAIVDAAKNVGAYSPVQQFYKEYSPPTLVSPLQGESLPVIGVFKWAPVEGAASYEFQVADNQFFNNAKSTRTDNTAYTPIDKLDGGKQYYWRVRIYDDDSLPGPYEVGQIELARPNHSIGNYVWIDVNNNGQVDPGEPPVPDGVKLELLSAQGATLGNTATVNGFYVFAGLEPGNYKVRLPNSNFAPNTLMYNYTHSTGAAQEVDPNTDIDQNDNGLDNTLLVAFGITSDAIALGQSEPTGEMPTVTGNPGEDGQNTADTYSNLTIDFGLVPPPNPHSIGNYVWIDANNNGQVDTDESPVPNGVVVELLTEGGTALNRTTRTVDGYYLFDALQTGSYRLRLAASNFIAGGVLAGYTHSTGGTQEADPNSDGDQNDNGLNDSNPTNAGIMSGVITLQENEPTLEARTATGIPGNDGRGTADTYSNLTVDFGVINGDGNNLPDPTNLYGAFLPLVRR